jgi:hypothetical protein
MTVHPFPSSVPGDRDPLDEQRLDAETHAAHAGIEALLDLLVDAGAELIAGLDELTAELDESRDRYGSFDRDHVLAHRAVAPGLLAGLCLIELDLCRAFHAALFRLLEDIGSSNGLIATPTFFVDTGHRRMAAAEEWLAHHPAPADGDDSRTTRDLVTRHAHELAAAVGSDPSLTFTSDAALRDRLIAGLMEFDARDFAAHDLDARDPAVTDEQIDWLADLSLRLLDELRHDVAVVGGARVWASAPRLRPR